MTATFQPGLTYWTRSIGDSECIFRITVAKRTAKFLTTTDGRRLGISEYDGREQVKPNGTYSMCAIISADKVLETPIQPTAQATTQATAQAVRTAAQAEQVATARARLSSLDRQIDTAIQARDWATCADLDKRRALVLGFIRMHSEAANAA